MTTKPEKKESYEASIKVLGRVYKAKGKDISSAIENLKVGNVAKGMSILTISKGKSSMDRVLTPPQTFRLFSASRLMREIAIKQISMRFSL